LFELTGMKRLRMCESCRVLFVPQHGRQKHCSKTCRDRHAKRRARHPEA